jgi:hypothetical protein
MNAAFIHCQNLRSKNAGEYLSRKNLVKNLLEIPGHQYTTQGSTMGHQFQDNQKNEEAAGTDDRRLDHFFRQLVLHLRSACWALSPIPAQRLAAFRAAADWFG